MTKEQKKAMLSFRALLGKKYKPDLISLIKACKLQYYKDYKTWIDYDGYGFSWKNKNFSEIYLPIKSTPNDLSFKCHPKLYLDDCMNIYVMQIKNLFKFWFWNSERFFRYGEFVTTWEPGSPCQGGARLSAKVLTMFIEGKMTKIMDPRPDFQFFGEFKNFPHFIQEMFNVE